MTYDPVVAAALSGASVRQLAYWRSAEAPLLAPSGHRPRSRVTYSFEDVVALRTFVYLRGHGVPLQRIRRAVRELRRLGEHDHLATYRLVQLDRDVAWRTDDDAVDLTGHPGHQVIVEMVDVLGPFRAADRDVVALREPEPGLEVDPEVRGGFPVIEGTRVPYDVVAALVRDGVPPDEVAAFYPSVSARAASAARSFDVYVEGYRSTAA